MQAILNYIEKYTNPILFIQVGLLIIICAIFLWLWFYNRKKYNQFKHQIPASVVKAYLDSIIQNSTALKSSLFRGAGLDVDGEGIPSVFPVDQLTQAPSSGAAGVGANSDDLNALRAQIAQLQAQLAEKNNTITELEKNKTELEGMVKAKQERIEELEKLLAEAQANGGGEGADAQVVSDLTKERDQLKETLQQYEVIEDDLANLKRLQQENEQLRKALEEAGGSAAPAPAAEPAEQEAAAPAEEEAPTPAPDDSANEAQMAAEEESSDNGDDKSPEDLLSEFEKMLG